MRLPFDWRAVSVSLFAIAYGMVQSGSAGADVAPPSRFQRDQNGVDLARGSYSGRMQVLSIGSGEEALSLAFDHANGRPTTSEYELGVYGDSTFVNVGILGSSGPTSAAFSKTNGAWVSKLGDGATLSQSGSTYILNLRNGTQYTYDASLTSVDSNRIARATKIKYASGRTLTMTYLRQVGCSSGYQMQCGGGSNVPWKVRLVSVTSSSGYQLHFDYASTIAGDSSWNTLVGVTALNMAVDGCAPAAYSCSYSQNWPSISISAGSASGSWTITDNLGRATAYTASTVRRPGSQNDDIVVNYPSGNTYGKVSSITAAGQTWQYTYSGTWPSTTVLINNPDGTSRTVTSDINVGLPTQVVDETGATISYAYDTNGRLQTATAPTGVQQRYTYDGRGNVVESRIVSTTPGTLADVVTSAGYDAVCNNALTCNSPNWTRDSKSAQTDYTYDATHGGVTTVTLPAGPNAIRPQKHYGYTALQGYYKDGSGTLIASGAPTYLLTSISECRTSSSCAGSADETRTDIAYGQQGAPNNLLPTSATVSAGDGSLIATSSLTYNGAGDIILQDGPLPGTADARRFSYDAARQVTMIVEPDPDGAGPQRSRATTVAYDAKGRAMSSSIGTANADGSSFAATATFNLTYDAADRKTMTSVSAGGGTVSLSQFAYDPLGRPTCTAVRMNPGAFQALPDACSLGAQGASGPDRIVRTSYNMSNRTVTTTTGYGTDAATTESASYTASGQISSTTDGNGNVTTYAYDGLDRPQTTSYPGGSYEQLSYDANGNVISRRLRDGNVIGYGYDALNRLISKDRPNTAYWETDQSYSYDNQGHMTTASDSNGRSLTFVYDALGRRTSQGDNWYGWGNASYLYDAAGHKTRLTWSDGNFVAYDYLATGAMNTIRDSSGNVLVSFGYDDLGQRTSLSRANGAVTNYSYDAASRLTGLTLAGGNQPNSLGFGYNAARQIASRTSSNDAYAWTGAYNVDRSYGVNGLNQLTNAGPTNLGYDGRGNLTVSGSSGYGYTVDNQLATAPGANLAYDPVGRLFNINSENGVNTTLTYDGADVIAEQDQNSGALLRRYVYGPGTDEPLIWYEGAGFGDRRWLHADERGSIVAVTNDAGNAIAINTYDEYGIPGSANLGRFQYTGQKWLPSVGLYDYKARTYSPTLGRFMQTDPIGYGDGLNWYNYVGGDPINGTDPTGLQEGDIVVTGKRLNNGAGGDDAPNGSSNWTPPPPITAERKNWLQQIGLWPTPSDQAPQGDQTPKPGDIVVRGRRIAQELFPPELLPFLFDEPPIIERPLVPYPQDPAQPPGPGWEFRGPPGRGAWYNPKTGESLRPDLQHPEPHGPHWDYRGPSGRWYRWFPDGGMAPKGVIGPMRPMA